MLTVHKYPIHIDDYLTLLLPEDARILTVQMQHSVPCIWALVDTEAPLHPRNFRLCGTGHELEEHADDLSYVGTFQRGPLVFHLFELV